MQYSSGSNKPDIQHSKSAIFAYYYECAPQLTVPTATNERNFSNINRASLTLTLTLGREKAIEPAT